MTKLLALLIALATTLTIFSTGAAAKPYYHKHHYRYAYNTHHKHNKGVLPKISLTPKTAEDLAFSSTPISGGRAGRMIQPQYTVSETPPTTNGNTVQVASNYVGLTSWANRKDLINLFSVTKQAIDPARTPWCAAFANAILAKIGIHGTDSLQAGSFASWGRHTATPKKNDIVLLSFGHRHGIDHVGFYVESITMSGTHYIGVLGGNQSHRVQVSYFPVWQVVSYRTGG